MIELCWIWGAVGFAVGVCFATVCLTIATVLDDRAYKREQTKRESEYLKRIVAHEWNELDKYLWRG